MIRDSGDSGTRHQDSLSILYLDSTVFVHDAI